MNIWLFHTHTHTHTHTENTKNKRKGVLVSQNELFVCFTSWTRAKQSDSFSSNMQRARPSASLSLSPCSFILSSSSLFIPLSSSQSYPLIASKLFPYFSSENSWKRKLRVFGCLTSGGEKQTKERFCSGIRRDIFNVSLLSMCLCSGVRGDLVVQDSCWAASLSCQVSPKNCWIFRV